MAFRSLEIPTSSRARTASMSRPPAARSNDDVVAPAAIAKPSIEPAAMAGARTAEAGAGEARDGRDLPGLYHECDRRTVSASPCSAGDSDQPSNL